MKKIFPCIECGLCCRKVGEVEAMKSLLDETRGCCKYLDQDKRKCTIYETRPILCNVSCMYDEYFSNSMSEEEFIQLNLKVCYQLNEEYQMTNNCQKILLHMTTDMSLLLLKHQVINSEQE